jgi:hypothetical protein
VAGLAFTAAFAADPFALNNTSSHVDRGCIEHRLDVRRVEFLDHFDGGSAVLRDLMDVGAFHEPEVDIGVAQAVGGPDVAVTVGFHIEFIENSVEKFALGVREDQA